VDALLDNPHEIDHQNVKGVTALALAAQKGRLKHLARILACGGQVPGGGTGLRFGRWGSSDVRPRGAFH
jgi:hypothetical protein